MTAAHLIAALCSWILPGLGQFFQNRLREAFGFLILAFVLWTFFLGWLIHLWAAWDAAVYQEQQPPTPPNP
jgi:TM2 domain-containing membrane protein YozV